MQSGSAFVQKTALPPRTEPVQSAQRAMPRVDWNDLQFVLAVADHGSLGAAARALGVNHTTVLRRVGAFEKEIGARMFERLPTGYALTPAGEELAQAARLMNETVTVVERRIVGRDLRLTGTVRVAAANTVAASILPEHLAAFAAANPEVQVELTTANAMANLTKRDADIAVRSTSEPPEHLLGRRVAAIAIALYAAPAYIRARRKARTLGHHTWVGPDDSLAHTTIARWMARELAGARVAVRADSVVSMRDVAVAGAGVAALPCYLGDLTPGLVRLGDPIPAMATELWLLTHPDLRGTARVRAVVDFLADALDRQRDLLEGRAPAAPGG
jgi:DNA-binding transcriptional LysR family regulator